jgi:hypothetical protein
VSESLFLPKRERHVRNIVRGTYPHVYHEFFRRSFDAGASTHAREKLGRRFGQPRGGAFGRILQSICCGFEGFVKGMGLQTELIIDFGAKSVVEGLETHGELCLL